MYCAHTREGDGAGVEFSNVREHLMVCRLETQRSPEAGGVASFGCLGDLPPDYFGSLGVNFDSAVLSHFPHARTHRCRV